jgi:hypothetical protein
VSLFLPSFGRLFVLLITLLVAGLCIGLGQLVGARRPATAMVAGWGLSCLCFVVTGGLLGWQLTLTAVVLGLGGIAGLFIAITQETFEVGSWLTSGRVLALAVPFIWIAGTIGPAGDEEFAQWLPNIDYLYRRDHFPSHDMPSLISVQPSIPYALSLIGYVVSLVVGRVAETAGIDWNALLLVAVAALLADILGEQLRTRKGEGTRSQDLTPLEEWGLAGIGLLAATILNPAFSPRLFLSNYNDGAVASVTAVATAAVVLWLSAEARKPRDERVMLMVAVGFCCTALAQLRQDGLTLFTLVFIAAVIATPLERQVGRRISSAMILLILPPALLVALVWREYQSIEIPDETLAMLGPADWHWSVLGSTVLSMAGVVFSKIGLFAVLGLLIGFAVAIGEAPHAFTPFQRTGVLMGAVLGVGKIAWLLLLYLVSSYTSEEAANAHEFFRFMVHVGPAMMVGAITLIPTRLWSLQPAGDLLCFFAPILAVLLPIVSVGYLRVDRHDAAHRQFLRETGSDVASLIGPAQITLIDPDTSGLSNLAVIRYQMEALGDRKPRDGYWPPVPVVTLLAGSPLTHLYAEAGQPRDASIGFAPGWREKDLEEQVAAPFVWFHDGGQAASQLAGMQLAPGASYLIAHQGGQSKLIKSWPFPDAN